MPTVSSTKQPLRGVCWKKVAISYESAGVALFLFPPRRRQTHSRDRACGSPIKRAPSPTNSLEDEEKGKVD